MLYISYFIEHNRDDEPLDQSMCNRTMYLNTLYKFFWESHSSDVMHSSYIVHN